MEYSKDSAYLHGFNLMPQFGPKRLMRLKQYFGSFEASYHANSRELQAAGIEPNHAELFIAHRASLNLDTEIALLSARGIRLLGSDDSAYPKLLKEIAVPPPLLYYRGRMSDADELSLAVVGSRMITNYGRSVIPGLIKPLAEQGVTIVSGLAYGVDAAAHRTALEAGGRTIAVLGCGIDEATLYPKDHGQLAEDILAHDGALISEYPPLTPAFRQHFVARNRIIAGLSYGTLVVECSTHSGALITAQHALEQNRSVYAVPGPIYSEQSLGPNNLLKMGARAVTTATDILEDLNLDVSPAPIEKIVLTMAETQLLSHISTEPVEINAIIKQAGLGASEVSSTLTFLEMKGVIKNLGAQQYVRIRKV